MKKVFAAAMMILALGAWAEGQGEKPAFDEVLTTGQYSQAIGAYQAYLRGQSGDLEARSELGILQTLDALEYFFQGIIRVSNLSARLWLPEDWKVPEDSWTYEELTAFLQTFADKLSESQKNLAMVREGDFKIPFALPLVAFDFTGDGAIQPNERLLGLLGEFDQEDIQPEDIEKLTFSLDLSDIVWLEGYVSLLKGWTELALWYDLSDLYYQFGLSFLNVELPRGYRAPNLENYTIRLREADKGRVAQKDFLRMFSLGQELWDYVLAETDDDQEWISGPQQTSPWGEFASSPELIESWKKTLSLWSKTLRGIYHIEMEDGLGLNLHRLMTEPRPIPTNIVKLEA